MEFVLAGIIISVLAVALLTQRTNYAQLKSDTEAYATSIKSAFALTLEAATGQDFEGALQRAVAEAELRKGRGKDLVGEADRIEAEARHIYNEATAGNSQRRTDGTNLRKESARIEAAVKLLLG